MIFERLLLNKDKEGIYVRVSLLTSVIFLLSGQRKVTETITCGHHGPNCTSLEDSHMGNHIKEVWPVSNEYCISQFMRNIKLVRG